MIGLPADQKRILMLDQEALETVNARVGTHKMAQRKASTTMIRTSIMRAMHQVLDADPKILDDPLAVGLVEGSSLDEILAAAPDSRPPPWFRSIFVLRSRYTEDSLEKAAASGIGQYVLLGAGMDTFAYRQPSWAARLRILEIDHPESQKIKREYLVLLFFALFHESAVQLYLVCFALGGCAIGFQLHPSRHRRRTILTNKSLVFVGPCRRSPPLLVALTQNCDQLYPSAT